MQLNDKQTEKLRLLSQSIGPQMVEFFGLMVTEISDIRTNLNLPVTIEKEVRLATVNILQEFIDKVQLLSGKAQPIPPDEFH